MDFYNETTQDFANGDVTITNLKVILVDGTYTFAAAENTLTNVNAAAVSGNGWTAGGEAITNAAVTTVNTDDSKLDGDDISVTATGGTIGPASALVVVDATANKPLLHYGFPSERSRGEGENFEINWNADGIVKWTAT